MTILFNYASFYSVLADLTSLGTSLTGIQQLRRLYARDDDMVAACLEHGVFDWLVRSLKYSADVEELERTNETLYFFANLTSSGACKVLLECGVTEQFCALFHLDLPDETFEILLVVLSRIVRTGREAVFSLVDRGVFAHFCRCTAKVYARFDTVKPSVLELLGGTMCSFLSVYPPLPFRVARAAIPPLFFALRHFTSIATLAEVVQETLETLPYVFRENSEGVSLDSLLASDDVSDDVDKDAGNDAGAGADEGIRRDGTSDSSNIFALVLTQLHAGPRRRAPALRLLNCVSALAGDAPARVFTPPALVHLQRLAEALGPDEASGLHDLLVTLSPMLACGPAMVSRVLAADVLQTVIRRVRAPQRDNGVASNAWGVARDLVCVILSLLRKVAARNGDLEAVPRTLLDAGALRYSAQALSAATGLSEPPPFKLLNLIFEAVSLFVRFGDTAASPALVAEGAAPRNAFLAAFLAAGGGSALAMLMQNEQVCAAAVDEAA